MAEIIRYLILANFFLIVVALFNHLVLSRETWFKTNRFVFISGILLCLALPLFNFNWFPTGSYTIFSIPEIIVSAKSRMTHYDLDEIQILGTAPYFFPWLKLITILYISGALIVGSLFLWKIKRLQYWTKKYPMKWFQDLYITLIPGEWNPFSFNGIVYYPQPFSKTDQKTRMILSHENIHIKQRHSWDIMLVEIVRILFFYNPAIYSIKKQIQINHEYLADSSIVVKDRKEYSQELIRSQLQVPQFQFIQQFNQSSFLKRRLLMLMKNKHNSIGLLKYLLLIPLTASLLWFTACTDEAEQNLYGQVEGKENQTIKIDKSKPAIEVYAQTILSSENSIMNKKEKQLKVVAVEMGKTNAGDKEVLDFMLSRIKSWALNDQATIESSELFKSAGLNIEDLELDPLELDVKGRTIRDVTPVDGEVFYIVEEMPEFDGGGLEEFRNWVQSNIKYPEIAAQNGIAGTVYVSFIIDKSGKVGSLDIVRAVDPSLDNEVKRVLSSAPDWTPGAQRGRNVNVKMSIPVKFLLQ